MEFSNSRRLWWAAAGLFALLRVFAYLPDEVNTFTVGHYLFSYTHGFHKRALLGSLLRACSERVTAESIYALSLAVLVVFAVALLRFNRKVLLLSPELLLLGMVLLGGPAILPHFAFALGYFDPFLVADALLILAVFAAPLAHWAQLSLAFALCALGVLIHESFALTAFPLVFAIALVRGVPARSSLWPLVAVVLGMTVAVQLSGQPSLPLEQYLSEAASRTNVQLDPEAFQLLYFHLEENFAYLAHHYASAITDARLFAGLVVPIPYFVMLGDLFGRAIRPFPLSTSDSRLVRLALLAPLALNVIGFDTLRWVSFACLNCSLLVLECVRLDAAGRARDAITDYVRSGRFWLLALLSLAIGPLHVVDGNAIARGVHDMARGLGLVKW